MLIKFIYFKLNGYLIIIKKILCFINIQSGDYTILRSTRAYYSQMKNNNNTLH